jgi:hypothetical protein
LTDSYLTYRLTLHDAALMLTMGECVGADLCQCIYIFMSLTLCYRLLRTVDYCYSELLPYYHPLSYGYRHDAGITVCATPISLV